MALRLLRNNVCDKNKDLGEINISQEDISYLSWGEKLFVLNKLF